MHQYISSISISADRSSNLQKVVGWLKKLQRHIWKKFSKEVGIYQLAEGKKRWLNKVQGCIHHSKSDITIAFTYQSISFPHKSASPWCFRSWMQASCFGVIYSALLTIVDTNPMIFNLIEDYFSLIIHRLPHLHIFSL